MGEPAIEVEVEEEEEVRNLPAVVASEAIMARGELSVDEVVAQKDKILQIMQRVMEEGVHYGRIPGIDKPTLFKPGAEAIDVALRLAPDYESEKMIDGRHLTVFSKCILRHIPTGLIIASGEGMCSTHESKYATRQAKRTCPECGKATIIKGKAEYGGGWVCWRKAGKSDGCGSNFADDDTRITGQEEGTIENPDLPDLWNTVLKMADKRALVAAVLNGTAASDVFTQDVEDAPAGTAASGSPEPQPQEKRQEGPEPFPVPKSWAKIEEGVKAADNPDEAWALFQAFIRACSYHLFGVPDSNDLDRDQKKTVAQKAAGAVVYLHENVPPDGPFTYFDEDWQRTAWATVLDGFLLPIPDYAPPEPPAPDPPIDPDAERIAAEF